MKKIKKEALNSAVEAAKLDTREALQIIYNELNHGQQKKITKVEKVREIFDRFGVDYGGATE